jgi:peptidyl-prolyl cis-trans isomerase SurA
MNKYCFRLLSLILIFLSATSFVLAAPMGDGIIAVVNSDVITLKDLKDYMGGVYRQLKIENKTPEEIQKIMTSYEEKGVNQLIDDKLILAAAIKKGIELRPEIVEKRLKEIKNRYSSEKEFLDSLNSQGVTVTDIKNRIINQMKSKYMVDIEVSNKVFVNPEEVTAYYNEHVAKFESKTRFNLDSIYISFEKGKEVALKRIREAREKLMVDGADFSAVSKEYSEAPSVGTLEQGQMVPAIEREVFNLKQGDLSQLVSVEGGVYLFKVIGVSPGQKKSLSEVKDSIYVLVHDQQFQKRFKSWIEKLRSKAYVEIRE